MITRLADHMTQRYIHPSHPKKKKKKIIQFAILADMPGLYYENFCVPSPHF